MEVPEKRPLKLGLELRVTLDEGSKVHGPNEFKQSDWLKALNWSSQGFLDEVPRPKSGKLRLNNLHGHLFWRENKSIGSDQQKNQC